MSRATGITTTSSGGFVRPPTGVVATGDVTTVSFDIKNSTGGTISGGNQVFVGYTLSGGGEDFPENFNTAALGPDGTVQRASFTTGAAPALADGIFLIIDNLPADISVTAVRYGETATYADGDTAGWVWDGADGNSSSSEAPDPAEGTADVGLNLAVAATGARDSDGVAALGLGLALAGTGARDSDGVAALGLGLAVATSGAQPASGMVALALNLAVAASGARPASGSAALGLGLAPAAAGGRPARGSATLGLNLAVAASGSNGQSGRPVTPWPFPQNPVSTYPWTPRPVRSFQEVDQP